MQLQRSDGGAKPTPTRCATVATLNTPQSPSWSQRCVMTPPADDLPCNLFVELVTEYLEGALSSAEAQRLEEHLVVCGGCKSVLDQFRAVIRMTGALAEDDVDALTPANREPVMSAFRDWATARSCREG